MRNIGTLLFSNFKTRALALILALLTWFYVYRESTEVFAPTSVLIDIRVPEKTSVLRVEDENGNAVSAVEVKLRGPRGARSDLRAMRLTKFVTAAEIPQGGDSLPSLTFEVTEEHLELPPKFRLVEANPRRIRVILDRTGSRYMQLEGDVVAGQPPAGFRVKGLPVARPTFVEVSGPQTVVSRHGTIRVKPVPIESLGVGQYEIPTRIVTTLDGQPVTTPTPITVTVEIEEEPVEQAFQVDVALVEPPGFSNEFTVELRDPQAQLMVSGSKKTLAALAARPQLLRVEVDIAAMRPSEREPAGDEVSHSTQPLDARLAGDLEGGAELRFTFKKPEKPETVVSIKRRPK